MSGSAWLDVAGLQAAGIRTVIVAAPDMQGRLFGRRMTARQFAERPEGIDISTCALAWDVDQALELHVDFAGFDTGWKDMRVVPDLGTLRPLGWLEGTALCMADLVGDDGAPVSVAPRSILQRQVARLAKLGFTAQVGSELEFYLYRDSYEEAREAGYRGLRATTRYHADYLISPGNEMSGYFEALRDGMEATGIELELEQGEWGLGQWEINMRYGDAVATADNHTLFKMATKEIAAAAGMSATFMARPATDQIGSSGHVHLSLVATDGGGNAFFTESAEHRLSPVFRQAVGGVLAHAGELMAWYAPTINSYRRVARDELVAGAGATWGYDNRTVSVRTVGESEAALRLEFRLTGADINPYLAIAGLLASVCEGLERSLDPGPPTLGNAYLEERAPLPADLGQSAEALRASPMARRAFGDDVVEHYAAVAAFEWQQFMAQVTEWETVRYFEQG